MVINNENEYFFPSPAFCSQCGRLRRVVGMAGMQEREQELGKKKAQTISQRFQHNNTSHPKSDNIQQGVFFS